MRFAITHTNEKPLRYVPLLTNPTMTEEDKRATRSTWSVSDIILSVLLTVVIIALDLYFTG